MDQLPLESLEDLIRESLDPGAVSRKFGLPHPLSKFAANGAVKEGLYADGILNLIQDTVWEEPDSMRYKAAFWFLLESEMPFFFACSEARIDAEKLRKHLRKCHEAEQLGSP